MSYNVLSRLGNGNLLCTSTGPLEERSISSALNFAPFTWTVICCLTEDADLRISFIVSHHITSKIHQLHGVYALPSRISECPSCNDQFRTYRPRVTYSPSLCRSLVPLETRLIGLRPHERSCQKCLRRPQRTTQTGTKSYIDRGRGTAAQPLMHPSCHNI